jgi:hypothetical protein
MPVKSQHLPMSLDLKFLFCSPLCASIRCGSGLQVETLPAELLGATGFSTVGIQVVRLSDALSWPRPQ